MLKHCTAILMLFISLVYLYERDFTFNAMLDYLVGVAVVLLCVFAYSILLKQTKQESDDEAD